MISTLVLLIIRMAVGDPTDQKVVEFLIRANQTEIQEARTALVTAEDPEVRRFAQRMVTDHSKALEKVQAIATKLGYSVGDTSAMQRDEESNRDTMPRQQPSDTAQQPGDTLQPAPPPRDTMRPTPMPQDSARPSPLPN